MTTEDNQMDEKMLQELLKGIFGDTHILPEMILAFVDGRLSNDTNEKIQEHIEECSECNEVYKMIQKSVIAEKEYPEEEFDNKTPVPIPPKLSDKLKVYKLLNSKRDEIVEKIAELFLPKDSWFCIRPTISMSRDLLQSSDMEEVKEPNELQMAAFSSGSSGDIENIKIITAVIKYVDYICDLLIERCKSPKEIQKNLTEIDRDSYSLLSEIEIDAKIKLRILNILESFFIANRINRKYT
jgi:hypothetical protein